jgi:hypothetical protein
VRAEELVGVGLRPDVLGLLRLRDPRWTSHTVPNAYRKNCRYSDCQFSATSTAKLEDMRYSPRDTGSAPWLTCWSS